MANTHLNWIENRVSNFVIKSGSTDTKWTHYSTYKKSHKTKWYKAKTKTIANGSALTHSKTIIETITYYCWKNAKETIGGKANQQRYKVKTSDTTLSGFLTAVDDKYFSDVSQKYSRVTRFEGGECSASILQNVTRVCPQPTAFNIDYADFDSIKSGTGKNATYTIGINRSEKTGYLQRNRKRADLRTIEISWNLLTRDEAEEILSRVSKSQWMKINFHDPMTNENVTKIMCLVRKQADGFYNGYYSDVTVVYEEV